jgi:glycosyltransferase involved in cell wall biosynthesis
MIRVPALSVFIPAHNEALNLQTVVDGILTVLPEVSDRFELVIVDDGSTDRTPSLADQIAATDSNVRVIHHATNRGYGGALRTGLYNCRYELIAFIDGDGQFDFGEIREFLPYASECDFVAGYRTDRQDGRLRSFNADAWGTLIRLLFGVQIQDVDCAFKLLHRDKLWDLPRLRSDGAMISAELCIRARNAGWTLKELPVSHYPRRAGAQTGANPKVILRAFRELFSLWRALRRQDDLAPPARAAAREPVAAVVEQQR